MTGFRQYENLRQEKEFSEKMKLVMR